MLHITVITLQNCIKFEAVPHPPFSPALSLSDFRLFTALKKYLKKKSHFQHMMEKFKLLWEQPEKFYSDRFQNLAQCGWCFIEQEGDDVEK
jgi:hypothetical protein